MKSSLIGIQIPRCNSSLRNYHLGTPGWLSGWASAFGSGHDPSLRIESHIEIPVRSLLLPLCLYLSLCLPWINKKTLKKKKRNYHLSSFSIVSIYTAVWKGFWILFLFPAVRPDSLQQQTECINTMRIQLLSIKLDLKFRQKC